MLDRLEKHIELRTRLCVLLARRLAKLHVHEVDDDIGRLVVAGVELHGREEFK
jgi:hypothetical protein